MADIAGDYSDMLGKFPAAMVTGNCSNMVRPLSLSFLRRLCFACSLTVPSLGDLFVLTGGPQALPVKGRLELGIKLAFKTLSSRPDSGPVHTFLTGLPPGCPWVPAGGK